MSPDPQPTFDSLPPTVLGGEEARVRSDHGEPEEQLCSLEEGLIRDLAWLGSREFHSLATTLTHLKARPDYAVSITP